MSATNVRFRISIFRFVRSKFLLFQTLRGLNVLAFPSNCSFICDHTKRGVSFRWSRERRSAFPLRTFAQKFSNINFFLKILPLKEDELLLLEMQKKWGVTDSVLERTSWRNTLHLKKSGFVSDYATMSVSPKILELDLSSEIFSAKYCLSGPIK